MSKFKILGGIVFALIIVGIVFLMSREGRQATTPPIPDTVASVNGTSISKDNFEKRLTQLSARFGDTSEITKEQKEAVATQMISEELLKQDAESKQISVSEDDVNKQMDVIKSNFESPEKFQEALQLDNLTEDELKQNVKESLVMEKYVQKIIEERKIEVSDEEIKSYYDKQVEGVEDAPSLEDVKDQIKQQLLQEKVTPIMEEIVADLRSKADVQVFI